MAPVADRERGLDAFQVGDGNLNSLGVAFAEEGIKAGRDFAALENFLRSQEGGAAAHAELKQRLK